MIEMRQNDISRTRQFQLLHRNDEAREFFLARSTFFYFFTLFAIDLCQPDNDILFIYSPIHLFIFLVFALQIIDISCAQCLQMFNNMVST